MNLAERERRILGSPDQTFDCFFGKQVDRHHLCAVGVGPCYPTDYAMKSADNGPIFPLSAPI